MAENNDVLVGLVADIVSAYVSNNSVPAAELPNLIATTHAAITGLGSEAAAPAVEEKPTPAVPIKKSITADHIVCLEDGKKFKSLKRHLRTAYDMTPEQNRARWGLPASPQSSRSPRNAALRRDENAPLRRSRRPVRADHPNSCDP